MLLWLTQSQYSTNGFLDDENIKALEPKKVREFFQISDSDYAFIFTKDDEIIFGRDIFGRKSLVGHVVHDEDKLTLQLGQGIFYERVVDSFEIPVGSIFHIKNVKSKPTIHGNIMSVTLSRKNLKELEVIVDSYYTLDPELPLLTMFNKCQIHRLDFKPFLVPNSDFSCIPSQSDMENTAGELISRMKCAIYDVIHPKLLIPKSSLMGPAEPLEQVTVSFSGGVDSLFVTMIAVECMPYVKQFNLDYNSGTDRQKATEAFEFLNEKYGPKFSMVQVNVTSKEVAECRPRIERAMLPNFTVLDESIASVVWFGCRAKGDQVFYNQQGGLKFGSDELFGGYARHRTYFEKGGWQELWNGLRMEIGRIGSRNFGRDDRNGQSNGVHLLAPFMTDRFVRWANQIPLPYRVDFNEPRGLGEKRILRAALRLLGAPSNLTDTPKKAMQFGSGYAKRENKGCKGFDRANGL